MEVRIDARKVALSLLTVAILLVAAHMAGAIWRYLLHGQLLGLVKLFNLNVENNVPTFFATFLFVTSAALLTVIAAQSTVAGREASYWRWLSIIFLFLAVDENASLHESLAKPLRQILPVTGPLFFAWVLPYGLAVLAVGLIYLRFVLRLPARTRRLIFASGGVFLAGALGFELIGAWYYSGHAETEDFFYHAFLVAPEEFLEMSGVILLIYALLDYLSNQLRGNPLRILIRSP